MGSWRSRTRVAAVSSLAAPPTRCSIVSWPALPDTPTSAPTCWSGLGCEQAETQYLLRQEKLIQIAGTESAQASPAVFSMQDQGGTRKTVEAGVQKVLELLPLVNDVRREPFPASEIVLATECGGSDGSSGITANPAVGVAADKVVACGGTAILGETTEIFGAEHLLTRRARTVEVADKLLERMRWWQWYAGSVR